MIWSGVHSLITGERGAESKPADTMTNIWYGRRVAASGRRSARRPYQLCRRDRRECHFAIDGLLRDAFYRWRRLLIRREIGGGIGFHNVKIAVGA